jgi:hypothetical protein
MVRFKLIEERKGRGRKGKGREDGGDDHFARRTEFKCLLPQLCQDNSHERSERGAGAGVTRWVMTHPQKLEELNQNTPHGEVCWAFSRYAGDKQ